MASTCGSLARLPPLPRLWVGAEFGRPPPPARPPAPALADYPVRRLSCPCPPLTGRAPLGRTRPDSPVAGTASSDPAADAIGLGCFRMNVVAVTQHSVAQPPHLTAALAPLSISSRSPNFATEPIQSAVEKQIPSLLEVADFSFCPS
jgi:hypothetical protein